MTLNENTLTINTGDEVAFKAHTNEGDNVMLTGIVKGTVSGDYLTLRVVVNEFLMVTIAAASVDKVNNLFINLNNFRDNIRFRVGV